jgi:ABC-type uncharacterized transport system fused permease/ATPase subunit
MRGGDERLGSGVRIAINGRSGSGKTSLPKSLAGAPPTLFPSHLVAS